MRLKLYTIETRKFSYKVFAVSEADFARRFTEAWKRHCEEYRVRLDFLYMNSLIRYHKVYSAEHGNVYRDGELFIEGK